MVENTFSLMAVGDSGHWENHQPKEDPMSEFQKGQAVKFSNPRGQVKAGKYVGQIDRGPGKGKGVYAQVDVDGKTLNVRPAKLSAA